MAKNKTKLLKELEALGVEAPEGATNKTLAKLIKDNLPKEEEKPEEEEKSADPEKVEEPTTKKGKKTKKAKTLLIKELMLKYNLARTEGEAQELLEMGLVRIDGEVTRDNQKIVICKRGTLVESGREGEAKKIRF